MSRIDKKALITLHEYAGADTRILNVYTYYPNVFESSDRSINTMLDLHGIGSRIEIWYLKARMKDWGLHDKANTTENPLTWNIAVSVK